jgi:putative glutamine amidotransferase
VAVLADGQRWRIGISQREQPATPVRDASDALDLGYVDWLQALLPNALLLPMPNFPQPHQAERHAEQLGINALLFSGGGDLDSQPRRAGVEGALLRCAAECGWPLLGICRGMQMLQVASGGELVELAGHVGRAHPLRLSADAAAVSVGSDGPGHATGEVNSWHRYGIRSAAPDWQVLATAVDGSIEAFRHRRLPWLGLMWHPERADGGAAICQPWLHELFAHLPH